MLSTATYVAPATSVLTKWGPSVSTGCTALPLVTQMFSSGLFWVFCKVIAPRPTKIRMVTMDLAQMILHRPCRVSPYHALLTYLGLLVSLTGPIRMFAQTSVQPGMFGVKLSGFENLVGGGASVGPGGGAGGAPNLKSRSLRNTRHRPERCLRPAACSICRPIATPTAPATHGA